MKKQSSDVENQPNMISGLGIGLALGIVFWSALEGLVPPPFDLIIGMATGLIIGHQLGRRTLGLMRYPPSIIRRLLFSGIGLILGIAAFNFIGNLRLSRNQYVLSSMLAIIPAVGFIIAISTAIGQLDEMQRRIQTEAIAIAFAGTAIGISIFFFLEMAGVPNPDYLWLLIMMVFMWLIGKLWTMWRYR